jgi:hypothetical protein
VELMPEPSCEIRYFIKYLQLGLIEGRRFEQGG